MRSSYSAQGNFAMVSIITLPGLRIKGCFYFHVLPALLIFVLLISYTSTSQLKPYKVLSDNSYGCVNTSFFACNEKAAISEHDFSSDIHRMQNDMVDYKSRILMSWTPKAGMNFLMK